MLYVTTISASLVYMLYVCVYKHACILCIHAYICMCMHTLLFVVCIYAYAVIMHFHMHTYIPYMHAHLVVYGFVCTLYSLGRDCGFKEENEIAVAIKYAKEQG